VLPLLVGLGLDELSMSAPAIPATKARLARLDSRACRQLLNQAMQCRTSLEVEHCWPSSACPAGRAADYHAVHYLNSDWRSKEEVLKGMTDNLLLAGAAATRVSWRPISGRAKRYFPPGWASALPFRTASRSILSSRPSAWLVWPGRWRGEMTKRNL
jgi:fructose-specific PTS system IIA-like component